MIKRAVRLLAFILSLAILFNNFAFAAGTDDVGRSIYSDWNDVGAKYREAVMFLSVHSDGLNVFQGSDGKFNPKYTFTRAEVISLVAVVTIGGNPNKLELNTLFASDAAREPRFSDVPRAHWAYGAINYASRMGFIEGHGDNTFNPSSPVTVDTVNSMLLSLLGVKAEDKNGTDWVAKTTAFMRAQDIKLDAEVVNFNPTREEVASALNIAVHTPVFSKKTDGTYAKQDRTLMQSAFGYSDDDEKQAITITGKVIGTKYANLHAVNNYNRNVLLEGVGVNDGMANGTVFRLEAPAGDDVVPVALLGRVITLKVVKVSEGLYRAANGAKAVPVYTTDVVSLPLYNDGTLNSLLYDNSCAEIPTSAYGYAGTRGNAEQFRGAYTNYGAGSGYDADWKPKGNWTYAYAVTFGNTNYYSEVFYLNYRALMVSDIYDDGTITFKALDDTAAAGVNSTRKNTFENGSALGKGDIIVAVVDAQNNIITAEKVASKTGVKQGNTSGGGVVIDGISYEIWDKYVNYANRQMPGSWGSGVQDWIQVKSNMTYWAFRPVYGEFTGSSARIFHSSAPNEYKGKLFEWDQVAETEPQENYCILIKAEGGGSTNNAAVTIVAANGKDSGVYKLNNLYVREVKSSFWGSVMQSSLAQNPVKLFGSWLVAATQGITWADWEHDIGTANGLFWADTYNPTLEPLGSLGSLTGICVYSYKILSNGYIDLTELDAGVDSGLEIIRASGRKLSGQSGSNTLIVDKDNDNKLLYSQGRALNMDNRYSANYWLQGVDITNQYALNTANTAWFILGFAKDPTVLNNWRVGNPNNRPNKDVLIFTVSGEAKFIIYEEE